MDIAERLGKIINDGGSFYMHSNDLERLKESAESGQKPAIFEGVKVYGDKSGCIREGKVIASVMGGDLLEFEFRRLFATK